MDIWRTYYSSVCNGTFKTFSCSDGSGISQGGTNPKGGRQPIIWPKFPENCMKMKKIGPSKGGARPNYYYVDPPLCLIYTELQVLKAVA